jgi:hypothetical protein
MGHSYGAHPINHDLWPFPPPACCPNPTCTLKMSRKTGLQPCPEPISGRARPQTMTYRSRLMPVMTVSKAARGTAPPHILTFRCPRGRGREKSHGFRGIFDLRSSKNPAYTLVGAHSMSNLCRIRAPELDVGEPCPPPINTDLGPRKVRPPLWNSGKSRYATRRYARKSNLWINSHRP